MDVSTGKAHLRALVCKTPSNHQLVSMDYKGIGLVYQYQKTRYKYFPIMSMVRSSKGHKVGCFIQKTSGSTDKLAPVGTVGKEYKSEYNISSNSSDAYNHIGGGSLGLSDYVDLDNRGAWDDSEDIPTSSIDDAFNRGIPMLLVSEDGLGMKTFREELVHGTKVDEAEQGFVIRDIFGNSMKMDINWDAGDWWGAWKVSKVDVV